MLEDEQEGNTECFTKWRLTRYRWDQSGRSYKEITKGGRVRHNRHKGRGTGKNTPKTVYKKKPNKAQVTNAGNRTKNSWLQVQGSAFQSSDQLKWLGCCSYWSSHLRCQDLCQGLYVFTHIGLPVFCFCFNQDNSKSIWWILQNGTKINKFTWKLTLCYVF